MVKLKKKIKKRLSESKESGTMGKCLSHTFVGHNQHTNSKLYHIHIRQHRIKYCTITSTTAKNLYIKVPQQE